MERDSSLLPNILFCTYVFIKDLLLTLVCSLPGVTDMWKLQHRAKGHTMVYFFRSKYASKLVEPQWQGRRLSCVAEINGCGLAEAFRMWKSCMGTYADLLQYPNLFHPSTRNIRTGNEVITRTSAIIVNSHGWFHAVGYVVYCIL